MLDHFVSAMACVCLCAYASVYAVCKVRNARLRSPEGVHWFAADSLRFLSLFHSFRTCCEDLFHLSIASVRVRVLYANARLSLSLFTCVSCSPLSGRRCGIARCLTVIFSCFSWPLKPYCFPLWLLPSPATEKVFWGATNLDARLHTRPRCSSLRRGRSTFFTLTLCDCSTRYILR